MIRVFISSPYSHPDPAIMADRVTLAGNACAWLWTEGYAPYSPIAHWHQIAANNSLPTCANAWIDLNRTELAISDAVAFLHLDGWRDSAGMAMERKWAADKPQATLQPVEGGFEVVRGALEPNGPHGAVYCDGNWWRIE